jgi:hypothetical protein
MLEDQARPTCDLCGKVGYSEVALRSKTKAMASAKKDTEDRNAQWKKEKAEESQSFAATATASSNKKDDSDEE